MEISPIKEQGVADLIEMAAQEGWNPGIHDAKTFFEIDPEGFLGVYEKSRLIGGGAIVRHSDQFGFMGLFLMAPEFRGRGIGRKLWYERRNRLLERLGDNASIGMDGVSAMVDFYREGGFEPQYLSSRFQTTASLTLTEIDGHVTPIYDADLEDISDLDRRCFPGERPAYLSAWLRQPGAQSLCYRQENGKVAGFGTLRPCREGSKIGPLFAETPDVAKALMAALLLTAKDATVSMDVPSRNPIASQLCKQFEMKSVFECTRMYFGPKPTYDPSLIYGLTSFELG